MAPENQLEESKFVVIENVTPAVSGGQFPIKAIPGDTIDIQASIFGYGRMALAAIVLFQSEQDNVWNRAFMNQADNDCWYGSITVEHPGNYVFKIKAWIDPAASWQNSVRERMQADMPIADLLAEGKVVLQDMQKLAGKEDKGLMNEALRILGDEMRQTEAGQLAISYRFTEWSKRYPNSNLFSETEETQIKVYNKTITFSSWYTLYPRSTSANLATQGTFQDVEGLLPRIADLGFDVLHFPPIHPIGSTLKKGKNGMKNAGTDAVGSVYAIGSEEGGHDAIHPGLGSIDDLKNLIFEAKSFGIEIAMDLALLFSPDHPWVIQYPDWFANVFVKPKETESKQKQTAFDAFPLVVGEANWTAAKKAVIEIILRWANWGIRIIRVDSPDNQPPAWWTEIFEKCNDVHPDLIFYAGTFTRPTLKQYFAKSGVALSDSYFMWRNTRCDLEQYIHELSATELKNYYKPIFWVNTHQVNPYNLQSGHEPQHLVRFFLAATLAGCYGIYGPVFEHVVHEPFPGKEDYWDSEKYEIKTWDWKKETKLTYLIGLINRLRKENAALQQTNNIRICESTHQNIIVYLKATYQNHIMCVVNLDAHNRQSAMIHVPIGMIGKSNDQQYIAHDLITGARYVWKGERNYVELDPYIMPFHLLRIEDYRPELDGR